MIKKGHPSGCPFCLRAAGCRPYGDAKSRYEIVGRGLAPAAFIACGDGGVEDVAPYDSYPTFHASSGSVTAKKQAATSSGERVHSSASHHRTVCTKAAAMCCTR